MSQQSNELPNELLECIKKHISNDNCEISADFVCNIADVIESYYRMADKDVDAWIRMMYNNDRDSTRIIN